MSFSCSVNSDHASTVSPILDGFIPADLNRSVT